MHLLAQVTKGSDQTSTALAEALGVTADQILLASTGVIGEPLDTTKITGCLPELVTTKNTSWSQAAEAILTTDTFPKGAHINCDIDGITVNICGITKGSEHCTRYGNYARLHRHRRDLAG